MFEDELSVRRRRSQLLWIDYVGRDMLTLRDQIGNQTARENEFKLCGSRLGDATQDAVSLAEDRSARVPESAGINFYLTCRRWSPKI